MRTHLGGVAFVASCVFIASCAFMKSSLSSSPSSTKPQHNSGVFYATSAVAPQPASATAPQCSQCHRSNHHVTTCWILHPELQGFLVFLVLAKDTTGDTDLGRLAILSPLLLLMHRLLQLHQPRLMLNPSRLLHFRPPDSLESALASWVSSRVL